MVNPTLLGLTSYRVADFFLTLIKIIYPNYLPTLIKKKIEKIHRYYAPVQLLALLPILYFTVQKGTPVSAGPLKVRGPIWFNRSNRPKTGPDDSEI